MTRTLPAMFTAIPTLTLTLALLCRRRRSRRTSRRKVTACINNEISIVAVDTADNESAPGTIVVAS